MPEAKKDRRAAQVKCLVWDLDNTLWDGTLAETDDVRLREEARCLILELDRRGILQSIASKNNHELAVSKLVEFGLDEYFLYPQIGWGPKSEGIQRIVEALNIGADAVAFIDDQEFERDEVRHSVPQIRCFDAAELNRLSGIDAFVPPSITSDGSARRLMCMSQMRRNQAEAEFHGTPQEFLATLNLVLTIERASAEDLARAEELTLRTHQLNTTGRTFSRDELSFFRTSPDHLLLMASLVDRYGTYGRVGLTLLECTPEDWTIRLFITSCRVMSRGIGGVLLNWIAAKASQEGVRLRGEFIPTERNRVMEITYRFANFREVGRADGVVILEHDSCRIQPSPAFMKILAADDVRS